MSRIQARYVEIGDGNKDLPLGLQYKGVILDHYLKETGYSGTLGPIVSRLYDFGGTFIKISQKDYRIAESRKEHWGPRTEASSPRSFYFSGEVKNIVSILRELRAGGIKLRRVRIRDNLYKHISSS
jgi:hypothetical protein